MSTTSQGPYSAVDDLETTADYPPVSPAAPADALAMPERAAAPTAENPLRAHQEEIRNLRDSVAVLTTNRDQLQADLTALTAKLHELEQLPREGEEQRAQHEREQRERDGRLDELTQELAARAEQLFLTAAERDDLQARLERARADLGKLAQQRERQTSDQADTERERLRRDAVLARSHDDLTELQRQVTGHREALQRAEARRQVFESMLRDREQLLDERDLRLRALQDELHGQQRDHGVALERANAQLAAALARAVEAERQFAEPPQQAPPRDVEPAARVAAAPGPDSDSQRRIAALEGELADAHEAVRALQEQLQGAQDANEALRGDLAAAELQIHDAACELQRSNARLLPLQTETTASVPSARTRQRLLVRTEGDAGIVHVLGRRTTIGRIPANDLCIDADSISRHHAVVLVTDSSTVVEDLNSTNGVFVNDTRVTRHELREGDLLTIGKTSFRYVLKPADDQG